MKQLALCARKLLENQLARSMGLDHYAEILEAVKTTDVSRNLSFQHSFNAFYRVRRNAGWREKYYCLFETAKEKHYSFSDIISSLYQQTGNVEASFSSKMLAAIDPGKPIWDQYVLHNLGLELKGKAAEAKVSNAIETYNQIEKWYSAYLKTDGARECIQEFDRWLSSYTWISDVKKIDYLLWSKRD